MAAVLVGFAALVADLGRMYVTKTEVQSAMDACALAAAAQLQPGAGATVLLLDAATAHGRATLDATRVSPAGVRPPTSANRVMFQTRAIVPATTAVTFAATLTGTYQAAGAADPVTSRFARCEYPVTGVVNLLSPILNTFATGTVPATMTVAARATASRSPGVPGNPTNSTSCGLFPAAVCMAPGGTAANNWNLTKGQWIHGPANSGGGGGGGSPAIGPGNYGWIDFSPPAGGAAELGGLLRGQGACGSIPIGTSVGQTGNISSAYPDWNSRFGLYGSGGAPLVQKLTAFPPDYTGYGYTYANYALAITAYPNAAVNAYQNDYLARRAAGATFNGTSAGFANNNFNATTFSTSPQYLAYGRQRRVVAAPVVDCSLFSGGSGQPPIAGYACLFLLRPYPTSGSTAGTNTPPTAGVPGSFNAYNSPEVEYLGPLSDADTPCRLSGTPSGGGGGGASASLVPRLVQ